MREIPAWPCFGLRQLSSEKRITHGSVSHSTSDQSCVLYCAVAVEFEPDHSTVLYTAHDFLLTQKKKLLFNTAVRRTDMRAVRSKDVALP